MFSAAVDSKRSAPRPGAVADVVADEVRDDGGVAGVVLGDAGLDLADEVGADVGGLGVDAAAELGEERHEGGAEAVADDHEGDLSVGIAEELEHGEQAAHAEERHGAARTGRHRAAAQGDLKGVVERRPPPPLPRRCRWSGTAGTGRPRRPTNGVGDGDVSGFPVSAARTCWPRRRPPPKDTDPQDTINTASTPITPPPQRKHARQPGRPACVTPAYARKAPSESRRAGTLPMGVNRGRLSEAGARQASSGPPDTARHAVMIRGRWATSPARSVNDLRTPRKRRSQAAVRRRSGAGRPKSRP